MSWRSGLAVAALAASAGLFGWLASDGDPVASVAPPESREERSLEAGRPGVEPGPATRRQRSPGAGTESGPLGAAPEPEEQADARLREIESTWRATADGRDEDGSKLARLAEALEDPDPAVAALAEQALEDLFALELASEGLLEPGPRALDEAVEDALGATPDDVRAAAIGELALSDEPEAIEALLEVARSDPSPENRQQALESLWRSVADGRDVDGSIQSAIEAALGDRDAQTVALAESALADLAKLPPRLVVAEQASDGPSDGLPNPGVPGLSEDSPAPPRETTAAPDLALPVPEEQPRAPVDTRHWEEVAEAARSGPDPEKRGKAIDELSLSLDEYPEAADALRDIAGYDRAAENRQRAVETLWRTAADGSDSDGLIRAQLEASVEDEDPGVALLAQQALEDLDALQAEREKSAP